MCDTCRETGSLAPSGARDCALRALGWHRAAERELLGKVALQQVTHRATNTHKFLPRARFCVRGKERGPGSAKF